MEQRGAGGIAHYAFNLCQALAPLIPVTLATAYEYELDERPRDFAVAKMFRSSLIPRGANRWAQMVAVSRNIENLVGLVSLARRWNATVVHLQGPTSPRFEPFLFQLSRRLRGPVCVTTVHDVLPYEHADQVRKKWTAAYVAADGLIAHSRGSAAEIGRVHGDARDVRVIQHGDYSFFRPARVSTREEAVSALGLPSGRRFLLCFGYVRVYKGLDLLADAWPIAIRSGLSADVDLVLAGEVAPDAEPHLAELRAAAGSRLHAFPGYVDHDLVASYFVAAEAVLLPYRQSFTSGLVPLAFSMGRPVVATAVGNLGVEVESGISGLVAKPDDPRDFARQLVHLFTPGLLPHLAEGAARAGEGRPWSAIAEETVRFYRDIANRSGRVRSPGVRAE